MKLADLPRVGELKKQLDYLGTIRRALNGPMQARIEVDGIHLRPALCPSVFDAIEIAINDEARAIRANLAQLGVTTDDGGEA